MTDSKTGGKPAETAPGNTAVKHQGDHDRVQMLSLRADGTPDQHNPEIIGDPEVAKAAAGEQFRQQAVSAADVRATSVPMMTTYDKNGNAVEKPASEAVQDPEIEARQKEHEAIEKEATKAADAMVDALSKSDKKD